MRGSWHRVNLPKLMVSPETDSFLRQKLVFSRERALFEGVRGYEARSLVAQGLNDVEAFAARDAVNAQVIE